MKITKTHITPEQMMSYVYNEIDSESLSKIENHLQNCDKCKSIRDELLETMDLFNDFDQESGFEIPPMGIEKRISNELKESKIKKSDQTPELVTPGLIKEIMTPCDLAQYLRVPIDNVYELLSELPHFNFAGSIRFRKSSIDRWLEISEKNSCNNVKADPDIEEFTLHLWKDRKLY